MDVKGAHAERVVKFGGCLVNVRVAVVVIIIIRVSCKYLNMFNIIKVLVKNDVERMQRDVRGNACRTNEMVVRYIKVWFAKMANIMMSNISIIARTRGTLAAGSDHHHDSHNCMNNCENGYKSGFDW